MLLDIELDILRFLDRATLEELQMHSLYLRDLVKRQERKLPLRRIHNIHVSALNFNVVHTKKPSTRAPKSSRNTIY